MANPHGSNLTRFAENRKKNLPVWQPCPKPKCGEPMLINDGRDSCLACSTSINSQYKSEKTYQTSRRHQMKYYYSDKGYQGKKREGSE